MKTVLFICTGNYYRSRFAEEVFNHHAQKHGLNWRADSAGLRVPETRHENPGSISHYALDAFKEYRVHSTNHNRDPKQVTEALLNAADLIIATSLVEHQSMAQERIPLFLEKITFWDVEDVEFVEPAIALKALFDRTHALLKSLRAN